MIREVKDGDRILKADMSRKAVRLHHPTLRNCVWTFELPDVRFQIPHDCPMCGKQHFFKTVHLILNANGDVTVDPQLYEQLRALGIAPEVKAMKEVVPRPFTIRPSLIDQSAQVTHGGPPVVSRENGLLERARNGQLR